MNITFPEEVGLMRRSIFSETFEGEDCEGLFIKARLDFGDKYAWGVAFIDSETFKCVFNDGDEGDVLNTAEANKERLCEFVTLHISNVHGLSNRKLDAGLMNDARFFDISQTVRDRVLRAI